MTETEPPVIPARRVGKHLIIWCPYCHREHVHGACLGTCTTALGSAPCTCPAGSGDGHRVAHCHNPRSPYHETGYVLREPTR